MTLRETRCDHAGPVDPAGKSAGAQAGIALLVVLWALTILAVVAASFAAGNRTELRLARNVVEQAKAEALADAALYRAVLALSGRRPTPLLEGDVEERLANRPSAREAVLSTDAVMDRVIEQLSADGTEPADGQSLHVDQTEIVWRFGDGEARLSILDEGGKIDLNAADPELIDGLLRGAGLDQAAAAALRDAILDYQDPDDARELNGAEDSDYYAADLPHGAKDAPFEAIEELQRVFGMTPAIYRQIAGAVTVHTGKNGVDPRVAPAAALLAFPGMDDSLVEAVLDARAGGAAAGFASLVGSEDFISWADRGVYTVRAEGRTDAGASFIREAVIGITRDRRRPFVVHAWRRGGRGDETIPDLDLE